MQASIQIVHSPRVVYLLRIADTCLILGQRLGEWCGHGPVLEEDIALTNMALDLLGAARGLYQHVGQLEGMQLDEDQLAFLRDERDYFNLTLAELPNGDYGMTVLRSYLLASFCVLLWEQLARSTDETVQGVAGKAVKEAQYHREHYAAWTIRLGDGTDESHGRMQSALDELWRYTPELFTADEVDAEAAATRLGPAWDALRDAWLASMEPVLRQATLRVPEPSPFRSTGKFGRHSEHLGYILAEMQFLQRNYPGGVW
jgi:ring-1,2-phenylacetyl-CoA epoxidase subunit PaaC